MGHQLIYWANGCRTGEKWRRKITVAQSTEHVEQIERYVQIEDTERYQDMVQDGDGGFRRGRGDEKTAYLEDYAVSALAKYISRGC